MRTSAVEENKDCNVVWCTYVVYCTTTMQQKPTPTVHQVLLPTQVIKPFAASIYIGASGRQLFIPRNMIKYFLCGVIFHEKFIFSEVRNYYVF